MAFGIDLLGKVERLSIPKSTPILPLFEAVINSIEAINERTGPAKGEITIEVVRESQQPLMEDRASRSLNRIISFIITDNGSGFNKDNLISFFTSESRKKIRIGGKGVGRFIWLKAFSKIIVNSCYNDNGWSKVDFEFSSSSSEPPSPQRLKSGDWKTSISLIGLKEKVYNLPLFPKNPENIADKIVEHCFEYFARNIAPKITLSDPEADNIILLNEHFAQMVSRNHSKNEIVIDGIKFTILHYLTRAKPQHNHNLYLCANKRASEKHKISLPDLLNPLDFEGERYIYSGFVLSDFFDTHVSNDRTMIDFDADSGSGIELLEPNFDKDGLLEQLKPFAANFLKPFTDAARREKEKHIQGVVKGELPYYRPFVSKHPEIIEKIGPNASSSEIDVAIYRLQKEIEVETKEKINMISNAVSEKPTQSNIDELQKLYMEFNEVGKTNLARYVTHRETIIQVLKSQIKFRGSNTYNKENAVHGIIFPLKSTSDSVSFEKQNLWMLDEKLAYHNYLASDLRFDQMTDMDTLDRRRPDVISFFDCAYATSAESGSYSEISIIEFKRPGRTDYQESDNPIVQAYDYIDEIVANKKTDHEGRPLRALPNTIFYVYIICDVVEKINRFARNALFKQTPDQESWYGFSDDRNALIQIISFDKLVKDAELRNKVLFDVLKGASFDWIEPELKEILPSDPEEASITEP